MQDKIDWSQYEVKDNEPIDWSQFEVEDVEEPREHTGLLGVASDLAHGLGSASKFALDIPNKLEKSGKYIEAHPGTSILHNLGQLGAETADIGKSLVNAPYNLNQYLARKHLLPQVLGKLGKLIPHLPEDIGVESALGLQADVKKGDELIRAVPDLLTVGGGVKALGKGLKKGFAAPDLHQAVRDTQKVVNESTAKAGKVFDKIEDTLSEHGKNIVPIDKDLITKAKSMLSSKFNKIITEASSGDYKALRKLQSALGAKERKGLASKNLADIDLAQEIGEIRNGINTSIKDHLENTGFEDLAKALKGTMKGYKDIKETYFSTPALAKVFGKSQKIPKNPATLLTEESTEMNRFMAAHPEMKIALSKALKHDKRMKNLGKLGGVLGIGTTAEVAREILGGK